MSPSELRDQLLALSSFPEVLSAIHAARFTGVVSLYFYCGAPEQVEIPTPPPPPIRIPLGKKRRRVTPSHEQGLTPPAPSPHSNSR